MTIRCPTCDTEQELSAGGTTRCVACGKDLAGEAPTENSTATSPSPVPLAQPDAARLIAALPTRGSGPPTGAFAELHRGETVYEYLVALIPVFGLMRVARSEVLTAPKRLLAILVGLASTLLFAIGVWAITPRSTPPDQRANAAVDAELSGLRAMVLEYRKQTGALPDREMWQRSVEPTDSGLYDPWGRPYLYESSDGGGRVGTLGRDGVAGGDGENADRFLSFDGENDKS